jgi:transposase
LRIEGIGFLNAIYHYINIFNEEFGEFKQGHYLSACIGLTPTQHSSGGKVKLGTIGKYKNTSLRTLQDFLHLLQFRTSAYIVTGWWLRCPL